MEFALKTRKPKARWTKAVLRLFPKQGEWTEDAYFALPDSNHFVELSEGEIIMPPPPDFAHQSAAANLYFALEQFNRKHKLGVVLFAPFAIRLGPNKVREPDIVFFLNEHRERINEQFAGPPDLAVEILSPATRKTDRQEKFQEYAQAGVSEYWLIDPRARTVVVYFLEGEKYTLVGKFVRGENAHSKLLQEFVLNMSELFKI